MTFLLLFFVSILWGINSDICPGLYEGTPINDSATIPPLNVYQEALQTLDIKAVFDDLYELLTNSQECWPADTFGDKTNYGGLFIRLTWHCAGTYRETDGKGGCAGGRQRFSPEASWPDNTNLDKARALLAPIKEKYGDALSWGDLMVFAGTAAIKQMGGPVTRVCAGRYDDEDGFKSEPLNNATQCGNPGNCEAPLGQSTIGLIYVNPEGINGNPEPEPSAARIRDVFGRMNMDDIETVALIGGGHAFGKCHGACPNGAGPPPNEDPLNPWPGLCGTGKGQDTFTSGFEGQWTQFPFIWDNDYFKQLMNDNYTLITGPGGNFQWENQVNGYLMLTTDLSLIYDDAYLDIVETFANDLEALTEAFGNAWTKLVEDGEGWVDEEYRVCVDGDLNPFSDGSDDSETLWNRFTNLNGGEQAGIIIGIIVAALILCFLVRYSWKCLCKCCCGRGEDIQPKKKGNYAELSLPPQNSYGATAK